MKKIAALTLLLFLLFQTSFAQKKDVQKIFKEALESFENLDYETTLQKIKEIKMEYRNPPPRLLSMEILSKSEIIKNNPFFNYELIVESRKLANSYFKNPNSKKDPDYNSVLIENKILNSYPKDLATFNALKEAEVKEAAFKKEREFIAAAEEKARLERVAIETKARLEREVIERTERLERERVTNQKLAVEKEKNRLLKVESDKLKAKKDELFYKNIERERLRKRPFSSLGLQSGEIAKYGLLYERGGKSFIGFHMSARTSLTSEEDILNGSVTENKSEIDLGPNFKISRHIYLNLGAGYGMYNSIERNDYSGTSEIKTTGYLVTSVGLMIRLGKVVNINGGISFMDIDKDIYKPEIIFGLSFNLR